MRRERPSLFSPPPNKQQQQQNNNNEEEGETSSQTSPYSLSNEDMNQLTDEFDNNTNCEELTTSGRTYEELVKSQQKQNNNNQRDSLMSEETEESDQQETSRNYGRQSVGFMLGRNSLSNWSTIGGNNNGGLIDNEDSNYNNNIPTSVQLNESQLNTGRKSNVSRHSLGGRRSSLGSFNMDTPKDTNNNNVSKRVGSRKNTTGQVGQARLSRPSNNNGGGGRRSQNQLNVSHISSSSSSGLNTTGDESGMLGDSWSPIRTSLENSFVKNVANNQQKNNSSMIGNGGENDVSATSIGVKRSGSLSPIRGRSSTSNTSLSSPNRSPVRSPLGDISPNRSPSRGNQSPKKMSGVSSPKQQQQRRATTANATNTQKKALSPNGTYSLKEAEGKRLSLPVTSTTGGSSSSNMALSSGGSASGSTSSRTLTTQSASKTKKLALPSLGSSRKQQLPKKVVTTKAPTTLSQDSDMTMLSPEKPSKGDNVRSQQPAPTPNSQRRVIKRFRASVPTANYLLPEDVMDDDSLEKNPVVGSRKAAEKSVSKSTRQSNARKSSLGPQFLMEMEDATESATYENTFEFPSDSIPLPRTKTLGHFHDQAVAVGSPSHQYQLNRAGTNLLSLQEVILPSIAYETNVVLKEKQAKAQRYAQDGKPDSQGTEVVKAIETCRRVVTKCTGEAMKVAGEAWRTREKEREELRVQRLKQETAQQKLVDAKAKKDRKEARAHSRHERYERQKREKKHNHPRNKELWQEVTKLMVEIQKLEKEERLWKDTLVEVNHLVENHQPPEMHDLDFVVPMKESELVKAVEGATLESTTSTLVGDVTLATERINWMLKSVSLAIEESDKLRKEAFDHYQDEHKFVGYPKIDDSKGLFMALSMESPAR